MKLKPTLRMVLLALGASAAACSGPKSNDPVGPRPGESTGELPADPSVPAPDAAGVPAVPGDTTTPIDQPGSSSVRRAAPRAIAQATDAGIPTRPITTDAGTATVRDAGAPTQPTRPVVDAGTGGTNPRDAGTVRTPTTDAGR